MREHSRCERCGYTKAEANESENWKYVRYYKRYLKVLCDECVDKLDGTWDMEILDDGKRLKVNYPYKAES
jgi:hypothetical protein